MGVGKDSGWAVVGWMMIGVALGSFGILIFGDGGAGEGRSTGGLGYLRKYI